MRLSHKKKLAHKRSGAAKGWGKVVRCRHAAREAIKEVIAKSVVSALTIAPCCSCDVRGSLAAVNHNPSLIPRGISLISSLFRRLREAGAAQADIIRGRIG